MRRGTKTVWGLVFALVLAVLLFQQIGIPWASAQPGALEVEWQRQLPGISGDSVIQTQDGGYMVLGTNASWRQVNDRGDREYVNPEPVLLRTDSEGNVLWQKTYAFEGETLQLSSIIQTSDGGYALCGLGVINTTEPDKMSSFKNTLYLLKIDSNGNVQWGKMLPSYNENYSDVTTGLFGAFIQTSDGGYAIAGGFNHMMYLNEIWFVKATREGDLEFAREIDSPLGGPVSVVEKDYGYAVVGGIMGRGGSGGEAGVVKIDSQGNTLDYSLFGQARSQENPYVTCASPASDGGFIIGGRMGVDRKCWILRTDPSNGMVWDKAYTFGSAYTAVDTISQTMDGGYVYVGTTVESTTVTPTTKYYTWVGKTDGTGALESQIYFLGASDPQSIRQTQDGGYVFVGTWRLNDLGNQKIWLVKLSPKTVAPADLPPSVQILSPENRLYPVGNISLTYLIDDTVSRVEYSIDGQGNVSFSGNTTIVGLPEGNHNLRVLGYDGVGGVEIAQVDFSVGEPFPTLIVLEIVVLVIVVAIAAFVLGARMHHRKTSGP